MIRMEIDFHSGLRAWTPSVARRAQDDNAGAGLRKGGRWLREQRPWKRLHPHA